MTSTNFSLYVILFTSLLCCSHGTEDTCGEGWEPYKDRCFKIIAETLSWNEAWLNCKMHGSNASLIEIPDAASNQRLTVILSGIDSDYWININSHGYRRITYIGSEKYEEMNYSNLVWNRTTKAVKRGYTNFKQTIIFTNAGSVSRCGYMDNYGFWYVTSCTDEKRSVCIKDRECQNYNGNICEKRSHCFLSDLKTGKCENGCQAGWTGERCDIKKAKAMVAIFCFHSEKEGKYALIRVNPMGVNYQAISIVSNKGYSSCPKTMFQKESDGILRIRLDVYDNGRAQPNCPYNSSGDDVYTWTVKTEEWIGLQGKYDRQYDLKCDFKVAETLVRTASQIDDGEMNTNPITVHQTTENVELFIRDPVSSDRLSEVKLGSQIILSMVLYKTDDKLSAKGISPYGCNIATVNGTIIKNLINENGCPVTSSPVSSLKATVQTSLSTKPFEAFTIYNHSVIVFSCQFEFCFHENSRRCKDRCSASYMYSMRGRRRRSTDSNEKLHSSTKTYLRLLKSDDVNF